MKRNSPSLCRFHLFFPLMLLLLFIPATSLQAAGDVKRILLVESCSPLDAWTENSVKSFQNTLNKAGLLVNYEIFSFSIRFQPGITPSAADIEALQLKLDTRTYDLIVVYNNDAADLFLGGQVKLPAETPLLLESYHGNPADRLRQKLNMTAVLAPFDPIGTIQMGLHLLPDTAKVALVIDATADGRRQRELLMAHHEALDREITIISGTEFTTAELLEQIKALPPHTLLAFHSWASSKEDNPANSYTVLPEIKSIFPGMILGRYDSYMDIGSDGGRTAVGRDQGKLTAQTAIRILNGEKASEIPYAKARLHSMLNYRAIQQFSIPADRIPEGTEIQNIPPDFLTRYRIELATGSGILFLTLAGFIAALLYRRREQKKMTMLFRNLPLRIFIFDRKKRILFSHVPDPVPGMVEASLTHLNQVPSPEVRDKVRAMVGKAFDCGKKVFLNFEMMGQFRHDEFLRLSDDNPFHTEIVMCISRDVSELHRAQRETARLAEHFRLTLDSIGDGVIATDREERVTLLNPVAAALTGYPPEEAVGMKLEEIFNIISYIDKKPVASPLKRALATGQTVELANHTDLIAKDGNRRHIADCASPIRNEAGQITGGVLVFRDVTDDYEKRDRLRMNNAILKTVEEIADIGYFRYSGDNGVTLAAHDTYWPRRNAVPVPPSEWITPEDLENFLTGWRKLMSDEIETLTMSYSAGTPKRYFELRAVKSVDEISGRREYFGVIQDITHSRESELRMRDNLQLLKNILDNLPGCFFVKNADDDFRYLMCNRQYGNMIGIDSNRIPGRHDRDIYSHDASAPGKFNADDRAVIDSGEKRNIRERIMNVDGQQLSVQMSKNTLTQSDGTRLLIGIGVDVTQQVRLEEEQKKLLDDLKLYSDRERVIKSVLEKVTLQADDGEALQEILHSIIAHLDATTSYIFHTDFEQGIDIPIAEQWKVEYQKSEIPALPIDADAPWFKLVCNHEIFEVPETGTEEAARIQGQRAQYMPVFGIGAIYGTGIRLDGKFWGYMEFSYSEPRGPLTEQEKFLLNSAAHIVEILLERRNNRAELDRSENEKRLIIDSIKIPMLLLDPELKPVRVNNAVLELTGLSEAGVSAVPLAEILSGQPALPPGHPVLLCRDNLQEYSVHTKLLDKDYLLSASPLVAAGKLVNLLVTLVDVTELYSQKEQLRVAMEQALSADRAKSYFLAIMSHELRTPLNAVIGFSELLLAENVDQEEKQEYLRSINCAGSALLNLINDVLDLSKLEAEQMNIVPVRTDLIQLLQEMISIFQLKATQKGLDLTLERISTPQFVYADHLRLRQILLNLIGNAIKFTHHGGVLVRVVFTPGTQGETGELCILVRDSGIGMSREQADQVFDPFYQAENTRGNRVYEGSGLGLPISMRLAQRMGGTIEVASTPGEGSAFTVKLQNIRFDLPATVPAADSEAGGEALPVPRRVLLVDDVPMNLKVLQAMLRKLHINCVCAGSAPEALDLLKRDNGFDLVLTDLWMPGMNGMELARQIRAVPETGSIPVVAVTADAQILGEQAEEFQDILLKPLTLETLQKTLPRFAGRPAME
ncbi:MAG: PAS domain-containing protein [Lentisphaeria bacterium]|nr:PAS domain-containing protein [Lentisphaeria bacterium]